MDALSLFAAAPEEHEEGPSVLQVPLDELIIGIISFLVILWVLSKFVFPGLRRTLEARTDAIEGGLERAAAAESEAQARLAEYRGKLANANAEAAEIRTQAQAERAAIIEQARAEAQQAASLVSQRAQAALAADAATAKSELSRDVGRIAYSLAEKVVGESLTEDERAKRVIDRFIEELESAAPAGGAGSSST
jgi:F-type H+-transporting ATPase subunit b